MIKFFSNLVTHMSDCDNIDYDIGHVTPSLPYPQMRIIDGATILHGLA